MLGTTAGREKAYIKENWKAAEKKNLTGAKGQVQWQRSKLRHKYSKICLKRTPYIPETWTNGK